MPTTVGLSPKLYIPVVTALTAILTSWVATGNFDEGEVRGLIATAVLAVVAYIAPAGQTGIVTTDPPPDEGDAGRAEAA